MKLSETEKMGTKEIDQACSAAIISYGSHDFDRLRDAAFEIIAKVVQDKTKDGVDVSSIVMDRPAASRMMLIPSPADALIRDRIDIGKDFLRKNPGHSGAINRLAILRAWIRRPFSMWTVDGDPPKFTRNTLIDPRELKISTVKEA